MVPVRSAGQLRLLAQLGGLWALGVQQPLFATLSENPAFFVAHHASPGEIVAQWEADQRSGRVDSLRECPAWRCRGLAPFTSRTGFSRHLSQVHGWDA